MQFKIVSALAALATVAVAQNSASFVNQDSTARVIVCTAAIGHEPIAQATVAGGATHVQSFPQAWQGNCYAYPVGGDASPGILAEFQFNGYDGSCYYDASAIVAPNNNNGVKMVYPAQAKAPVSGCQSYPGCTTAYVNPDDVQTLSSMESDFIVLLGTKAATRRHARHFVTGHHA